MHTYGFDKNTILDRLECFGGFASFADTLRPKNIAELSSLPAQTKLIPSGCKKVPARRKKP